jgi:hypothetical protein
VFGSARSVVRRHPVIQARPTIESMIVALAEYVELTQELPD